MMGADISPSLQTDIYQLFLLLFISLFCAEETFVSARDEPFKVFFAFNMTSSLN